MSGGTSGVGHQENNASCLQHVLDFTEGKYWDTGTRLSHAGVGNECGEEKGDSIGLPTGSSEAHISVES